MTSSSKLSCLLLIGLLGTSCSNKTPEKVSKEDTSETIKISAAKNLGSIEGLYKTQPDPDDTEECQISVEITKAQKGYRYLLKTKLLQLKGIARFTTNGSGEKYITLEGIKWDEYEGDISNEEENDSVTETKELEIPVGIDASYATDTLTIQNYGNSMNSYTKLSECGRKYIQLIRVDSEK